MGNDGRRGLPVPEIEGRILGFLRGELLDPGVDVGRDDRLLSGGLLDSIRVLRLATFVEEEFQLQMEPADFVVENFDTVAVLAAYVRGAIGDGESPPTDPAR
jgi:acyl carrier protein